MNGLYSIKPWFVRRLRGVEDLLVARDVSADTLTAAAMIVSVAGGAAIALGGMLHRPELWLAVPPLVLVRLALNALDGSVARRTRSARPFGAALNEVGDRVSDAATIGATSFVVGPRLGLGALLCAFAVSSIGVLALALTGRRDGSGPMGKADRGAALAAGAAAGALLGSAVPFVIVCWLIVTGSLATVLVRLHRLRLELTRKAVVRFPAGGIVEVPGASDIDEEMLDVLAR